MDHISNFMRAAQEQSMTYDAARTAAINILIQRTEVVRTERAALEGGAYQVFWELKMAAVGGKS